jgi:quercetin dioxygenase-like cupin family protein
MATHHAVPGEIVDLETWAQDLIHDRNKAIVKTDYMELARIVIPAGEEFPNHNVSGPIVVHCTRGQTEITVLDKTQLLRSGQLLYLMPGQPHVIRAVIDSVILFTIIFKK